MRARYPDITFDLSLDDGLVDLVAQGYDAGVRLGQAIAQDMVAIRLSRPLPWSIVASPGYFAARGEPATPRDLLGHAAIRYRFATSGVLPPWRFVDDGRNGEGDILIDAPAALCANDTRMIAELARQGLGIACLPDIEIEDDLAAGRLVRTLARHVPHTSGLYLYFPMRSQNQPKVRALVEQASLLAGEGVLDAVPP